MKDIPDNAVLGTLIQRISVEDNAALEKLYREMKDPIYRYALMLLQDYSLAEDAMQVTFLKIMANADTYRPDGNAKAWIFAITRNTCHDLKKKNLPAAEDFILDRISEDRDIDDLTDVIAVKEALKLLTPIEREIMSLHVFAGFRQTEIAGIMGISYLKVRSHYGYAIKKLRKELGHHEK